MDVFEAIRTRTSIRKFKPDPISEEVIRTIVDYATKAPSASNEQMWKFIAVTNRKLLSEMKDAVLKKLDAFLDLPLGEDLRTHLESAKGYSTFFAEAPVTIAVFREPYRTNMDKLLELRGLGRDMLDLLRQSPDVQSIGAAIENLCLAAHAMGYGTCWMAGPCIAGPEIASLLDMQSPWELAALVPLGIPDEKPLPRPRKPLEEVMELVS